MTAPALRLLSPALYGTLRYEARMARRRRAAWLALVPVGLLLLALGLGSPLLASYDDPLERIGATATVVNLLGSMGVAVALADRLDAQRRPGLRDLVTATPAGSVGRAAGVLLGPWLMALVPLAAVLLLVGGWLSVSAGTPGPLVGAVLGMVTIVAPGSLLLTVVATLLGLVLPVTAARVLVVPLWYWATAWSPLLPLPSITGTVLSPLGDYPAAAWTGARAPTGAGTGVLHPPIGTPGALVSIAATLAVAALLFLAAQAILARSR